MFSNTSQINLYEKLMSRLMTENIPSGPILWTLFLSCLVQYERVLINKNFRSTGDEGRTFLVRAENQAEF